MITFEYRLKSLIRNRYKDDLHSAMCYFKSGRVAYIYANYDKSLTVILRDEDKTVDCRTVAEVLNLFGRDELVRYET